MRLLKFTFSILTICLLCLGLNAQDAAKKEITIKILKEVDGKMTEIEKTFTDMNDPELQKLLNENELDLNIEEETLMDGETGETEVRVKVKSKGDSTKKNVIIKKRIDGEKSYHIDREHIRGGDRVWIEKDEEERSDKPFFGVMGGAQREVEVIDGEERVIEIDESTADGMTIMEVIEGSGAADAGLKAEDIITRVDKKEVRSIDDLIEILNDKEVGDKVKVVYRRADKKEKTTVTLGARPARKHRGHKHMKKRYYKDIEELDGEQSMKRFFKDGENMEMFILDGTNMEELDIEVKELLEKIEGINGLGEEGDSKESLRVMVMIKDLDEADESLLDRRSSDYSELNVNDLSFFPNPSSGTFDLEFSLVNKGTTEIRILDLNGQELYSRSLNDFSGAYKDTIDISEREKGVYILEIIQNRQLMHKKIVVQ